MFNLKLSSLLLLHCEEYINFFLKKKKKKKNKNLRSFVHTDFLTCCKFDFVLFCLHYVKICYILHIMLTSRKEKMPRLFLSRYFSLYLYFARCECAGKDEAALTNNV